MQTKQRFLFSRHPVLWAVVGLTLLAGIFLSWRFLTHRGMSSGTQEAAPPKAQAGVFRPTREQWAGLKVEEVKPLTFRSTLTTDGNIAINDDTMTTVFSPYTGRVTRVAAKLGDTVAKGAPLMAIAASEIVQGESDVAAARANLEIARATEKRQHDLFDAGAGAFKDWKQSQSDLVAAEASLASARGRLHILGKSEAEIATLEKAPAGSAETVLSAPVAGTVTQRQVGVGQYITSASGGAAVPIFTIANLSTVWLVANVRESDAPSLRVGQSAEVTVLAFPGKTFKAKISWIGAAVDPTTHRLPVRAEVQNPDGALKAQMFASFSIATSAPVDAPAAPQDALVYEGDTARVFVVAQDGSIAGRVVRTGRSREGMIEVLSGLHAGEKIVASGTLFIDRAAAGSE